MAGINYLWTIELEEQWSYDLEDVWQSNGMKFNVIGKTLEEVEQKAQKLAKVGKVFKDKDGNKYTIDTVRTVYLARITKVHA